MTTPSHRLTGIDLGAVRTGMSAERTLMSWLRTGISMISFGFTIYKVLAALRADNASMVRVHMPRNVGLYLIALGLIGLFVGIVEYLEMTRDLRETYGLRRRKFPIVFNLLIGVLGLVLFILVGLRIA